MKNVYIQDGHMVYDCEGKDCETPGVPHKLPLKKMMAMLETCLEEFHHHKDPRLEYIMTLFMFMWERHYNADNIIEKIPDDSPWAMEFSKLKRKLQSHYSHDHDDEEEHPEEEEYLN